jgi:glycosyltransferase involved in cell wall biosynthesis
MFPSIGVVVPTRNSARTLRSCLASITQQIGVTIDLVVIDNYSSDGTSEIVKEFPARFIQAGPERSAQRNRGLKVIDTPYVVFIDSDMILSPGCLADVHRVLLGGADAVVIPELGFGDGWLGKIKAWEKSAYLGNPEVEAARAAKHSSALARGMKS